MPLVYGDALIHVRKAVAGGSHGLAGICQGERHPRRVHGRHVAGDVAVEVFFNGSCSIRLRHGGAHRGRPEERCSQGGLSAARDKEPTAHRSDGHGDGNLNFLLRLPGESAMLHAGAMHVKVSAAKTGSIRACPARRVGALAYAQPSLLSTDTTDVFQPDMRLGDGPEIIAKLFVAAYISWARSCPYRRDAQSKVEPVAAQPMLTPKPRWPGEVKQTVNYPDTGQNNLQEDLSEQQLRQ